MKPISLEMTAFGSYKETARIDFEAFGSGIYVICGPTGAGKTTIFDAVMFALFEEVSAKPSKESTAERGATRDKSMVHSGFAELSTPTVVKLVFEENGKRYQVQRSIRFPRKKSGGYGEPRFSADLVLIGGEATGSNSASGSGRVTAEVESILHMDAAQFRQIVMLAQGEFRAFMEAKDDRRKEILGELFDSTPYQMFQDCLDCASKKLLQRQKEEEVRVENALKSSAFFLPESMEESERARYGPAHPDLEANLEKLLGEDQAEAEKQTSEKELLSKKQGALRESRGKAEAENELYRELQQKKRLLQELEERKSEMAREALEMEETGKAWHQVEPLERRAEEAEKTLSRAEKQLLLTQKKRAEAAKSEEKARREVEEQNPERKEASLQLTDQARRIGENLDKIEELQIASESLKKTYQEEADALQDRKVAEEVREASQTRLLEIETALKDLEDIDQMLADARMTYEEAKKNLDRFTTPESGYLDRVEALLLLEKKVKKAFRDAEAARCAEREAAEAYEDVQRRYFAGYAGILGMKLEAEFSERGEAVCPVCGSFFRSGEDHPAFAAPTAETPGKEELDTAGKMRDKAQKACSRKQNDLTEVSTSFEEGRKNLEAQLNEALPGLAPWTVDHKLSFRLLQAEERLEAEVSEKEAAVKGAKSKQNRKKKLQEERELLTKKKEAAVERFSAADKTLAEKGANAEKFRERRESLLKDLEKAGLVTFKTREEAIKAKEEREAQAKALEEASEKAEKNLEKESRRLSSLDGQVETETLQIKSFREKAEEEKALFIEEISKAGFTDEASYREARNRVGEEAIDVWLSRKQKEQNDFLNSLKNTEARTLELQEKNPAFTDLGKLDQDLSAMDQELKDLDTKIQVNAFHRQGHQNALDTVRDVSEKLRPIRKAFAGIDALSKVANGSTGAGGKRTFDGYVLSSAFEEVLQHASYYLTEMTGGKYELVHDKEASGVHKSAHADFRIQVQDTLTGQLREIGSLSGGEGFQASMALALGLSDTVQSHVSTVKIDTMFIDEGFGSLDSASLAQMLQVLSSLSGGRRQIGIISHVDALEESASKFIRVRRSRKQEGSFLSQEM